MTARAATADLLVDIDRTDGGWTRRDRAHHVDELRLLAVATDGDFALAISILNTAFAAAATDLEQLAEGTGNAQWPMGRNTRSIIHDQQDEIRGGLVTVQARVEALHRERRRVAG